MSDELNPLLATALQFYAAGLVPLPVRTDGSKAPAVAWRSYQQERPPLAEVVSWFVGTGTDGIGTLTGSSAGNLEMLEFEGRAVDAGKLTRYRELCIDNGAGELWQRLAGWCELTPSGGVHYNYRLSDGPARKNTKLACTAANVVLLETRGEGGFTVNAPSFGRTHPTGQPWVTMAGGPDTMGVFTVAERDHLFAVATLLDERTLWTGDTGAADGGTTATRTVKMGNEVLPGEDFNMRSTWAELLEPRGWRAVPAHGFTGWVRPDKTTPGISASSGTNEADNLYVFSSSTEFTTETPYSKFAAYALFEHNNNFGAAAAALREKGYGKGATPPTPSFTPPAGRHLSPVPNLPADPNDPTPEPPKQYDPYEASLAAMLLDEHGDVLRFCPERGEWLVWMGNHWDWDASKRVWNFVHELGKTLPDTGEWRPFKKRALSASGIAGIVKIASTLPVAVVNANQLDAHPFELNTPGGIVNLRTGELMASDPAKLHTRMTSCTPDFTADSAAWDRFLSETFGEGDERIAFVCRLMGYTATGEVAEHILPFCQGGGGNGKGVFLETCMKVLGEYAISAPANFLTKQLFTKHETEIARLQGARMVVVTEVNEGDAFDEAKVKLVTGGDQLTGRFMRGNFFNFPPTHTMWLMANNLPAVTNGGRAFWRRMRLLHFMHDVINEIQNLQSILANEHGPAVLAWIVRGAVDYLRNGLQEPTSVLIATKEYETDQDTVARFMEDDCVLGGGEQIQVTVPIMRRAYEAWCSSNGEAPVTAKRLTMDLVKAGAISARSMNVRLYQNVSLREVRGQSWRLGELS